MSTSMLSLCCGALPVGGVVRTYQTYHGGTIYHLGHCTLCGGHAPFAPGGELETSPKWLRLPPLHEWPKPLPDKWLCSMGSAGVGYYTSKGEGRLLPPDSSPVKVPTTAEKLLIAQRDDRWLVLLACAALAGWLAFVLLGTWSALHRGREGESGQRGLQGLGEQRIGSSHAPQPATKGQGGKQ